MTGLDGDLIDLLIQDHRAVESLFLRLAGGGGTPQQRRQVTDAIVAEVSRHTVLEERFLYPLCRRLLGDRTADRGIDDHTRAERALVQLSKLDVTDPSFDDAARMLTVDLRRHMRQEEAELFPTLRDRCTNGVLDELGVRYREAKEMAPTRPHPLAPDTPPWNHVSAPVLSFVDHLRDEISGRSSR
jgi:hemerythrin-like domain-containing protein